MSVIERLAVKANEERTLGSFVSPEIGHSLTSLGALSEVTFAFSMNGSLMMFTVKFFVALMLCAVSFMPDAALGLADTEIETRGGLCVTYRIMFERIFSNRSVQEEPGTYHVEPAEE